MDGLENGQTISNMAHDNPCGMSPGTCQEPWLMTRQLGFYGLGSQLSSKWSFAGFVCVPFRV